MTQPERPAPRCTAPDYDTTIIGSLESAFSARPMRWATERTTGSALKALVTRAPRRSDQYDSGKIYDAGHELRRIIEGAFEKTEPETYGQRPAETS